MVGLEEKYFKYNTPRMFILTKVQSNCLTYSRRKNTKTKIDIDYLPIIFLIFQQNKLTLINIRHKTKRTILLS